jgi:hypothetical protein
MNKYAFMSDECKRLDCINCELSVSTCAHYCHKPLTRRPRPISEDKWFDIALDTMKDIA